MSFGFTCAAKAVPRPESVTPSSESHTSPAPAKPESCARSTGIDSSARASEPMKRLRIDLAAVR